MWSNVQILTGAPVFNIQLLLNGLSVGAIFALVAYGLALVWGVTNVKNLAQGDIVMIGGYTSWKHGRCIHLRRRARPPSCAWVRLDRLPAVVSRVIPLDLFTSLLATFGLAITIQQSSTWSSARTPSRRIRPPSSSHGAVHTTQTRLIAFGLSIVLALAMVLFLHNSRMGQAIRATAQDPRAAARARHRHRQRLCVHVLPQCSHLRRRRRAGRDDLGAAVLRHRVFGAPVRDRHGRGPRQSLGA